MDKRITGEAGCLRYLTRQAGGGFWYHNEKLEAYSEEMKQSVVEKAEKLDKVGYKDYE